MIGTPHLNPHTSSSDCRVVSTTTPYRPLYWTRMNEQLVDRVVCFSCSSEFRLCDLNRFPESLIQCPLCKKKDGDPDSDTPTG